jgi:hypothetical protein
MKTLRSAKTTLKKNKTEKPVVNSIFPSNSEGGFLLRSQCSIKLLYKSKSHGYTLLNKTWEGWSLFSCFISVLEVMTVLLLHALEFYLPLISQSSISLIIMLTILYQDSSIQIAVWYLLLLLSFIHYLGLHAFAFCYDTT